MQTAVLLSDVRKGLVAVTGAAAEVLDLGLVHGSLAHWVGVGIAGATALTVYVIPNGKKGVHVVLDPESAAKVIDAVTTAVAVAPAAPTAPAAAPTPPPATPAA